MFYLNYLFILSVISRAQETTLTDEERGERLRKGFGCFKGRGLESLNLETITCCSRSFNSVY